jgi:hypothetical protein
MLLLLFPGMKYAPFRTTAAAITLSGGAMVSFLLHQLPESVHIIEHMHSRSS